MNNKHRSLKLQLESRLYGYHDHMYKLFNFHQYNLYRSIILRIVYPSNLKINRREIFSLSHPLSSQVLSATNPQKSWFASRPLICLERSKREKRKIKRQLDDTRRVALVFARHAV